MQIPFSPSPTSSLGVEWELALVDRRTRQLRGAATAILDEYQAKIGEHAEQRAKHELFESVIEVVTGVCDTVADAKADLAVTVGLIEDLAASRGLALMCSGTHPITSYADQQISPDPRYRSILERMQWVARRLLIFGVHVHVGVPAQDRAIPVVNALVGYIPHFLALSASSPFWLGLDTGLASSRSKVFESLPTAGLPYLLSDWEQFERFMGTLVSSGTVETIREVWWDVRPHPDFGTVELRICDGLPTLLEVGAIAALTQCLVDRMNTRLDQGYQLPTPQRWVVQENKWRAARYGLDAEILLDERGTTRRVRDEIAALVDDLLPVARRLECVDELTDVLHVLQVGSSCDRQRAAAQRADGDLSAVVDVLLREMKSRRPL
ncbi:glutamate--cysteine ligase [Protofrankia coriariae]|uniref:Putative glutamate--cysteine ligase 2 n=1 Tax=Protofrankia coriariae TaxID=1562887 RepID=A0ABR5F5T1_9ACTN|nr:glutamate--cysteine ligase [Protofrankia coriariae]KLL12085.1 carboxylate--amine ligase [Protofrankia coriariae]